MFKFLKLYRQEFFSAEQTLQRLISLGYERAGHVQAKGQCALRGEILDIFPVNFQQPARVEAAFDRIERMSTFDLASGKRLSEHNPLVIMPVGAHVGSYTLRPLALNTFSELNPGDFIVHIDHGIGKFHGVSKLKGTAHAKIEYADGDLLYVPLEQRTLLQKYIGFTGHAPRLHKLGGKLWQNTKDRAKRGITSFALDLLRLQARRKALHGFAFTADTAWQQEFERRFPYSLTADQAKAIQEMKHDMEMPRPMDRLLCGDVGYGKTEVAFRAAFKAVMSGKQVAILVPTTLLAEQHNHNLRERLHEFPVDVQMLSRFKTAAQQRAIIQRLAAGAVDIVVGTHRLLSADIRFKDLGLIIIDEEQRFGVKAKEKLKQMRDLVDVLTLTATPIPRTLYMSLLGVKDMSTINTPPDKRLPIETFVCTYDDELVRAAITNELERGGQTYLIHNRVQDIHRFSDRIQQIIPSARIAVGHGQMPEHELEQVMIDFIEHRVDVLVSTTIVESGLDIPNANTLIVNHAENFGLADLYQLRGRIGRFDRQAFAYFLTPKHATFNPDAQRRLRSIQKFTELGSGFRIAMEDLEIRGAGNLLGEEQHGYIVAVGFDLYCQLLAQAVQSIKLPDQDPPSRANQATRPV
ncbi:MAG: transcription-repair coupling factor [Candidatus Omnitrophica bacterium]|nr:transcription-repair coupling factor [Candidatus Omnitrophota bacterium]